MQAISKRPRWVRFSLRMLLLAVTVLCVCLGFQVNAARRQKEAVEAIVKAGGTVVYDYQYFPVSKPLGLPLLDYRIDLDAQPHGPAWLRSAIGDDCFRTVIAVYFNHPNANITKPDFDQIAKLRGLKQFVLEIDDPRLNIQDSDLVALEQQSQLEILQLIGTQATSAMLGRLKSLSSLTAVTLGQWDSDFDDTVLEQIGKMTNLKSLWLSGARVTDAKLSQLQKLTKLKQLYLSYAAITDAGLRDLAQIKQLVELGVPQTQLSRSAVRELQKALPNTTIHSRWPTP